jgi:hypothetical protein
MTETNSIIRYFKTVRPELWNESEAQRAAFVLHHSLVHSTTPDLNEVTDALAELIPEQREFWLNVQATWNSHFLEAMTAMFESEENK